MKKDVSTVEVLSASDREILFQAGSLGHKPWDPEASFSVQINFNSAVFVQPVRISSDYKIRPGLFKSWVWEPESNSYLFTIDKRYRYDEKRAVEPRDVEFAFVKSFLSDFGKYKRNYFFDIVGVEKLKPGMRFRSGLCDGVKVVGSDQIRVYLNKPNPDFIYALQDAIPVIAPVEDFIEAEHFKFKGIPRGTGPYKVVWSSDRSSEVTLEYKTNYLSGNFGRRFPTKIRFINHGNPLKNRPTLGVDAGGKGLEKLSEYTVQYGKIPYGVNVISFNYKNKFGRDKLFRKAVSLAIDRQAIARDSKRVKPTHELVPSMYLGRSRTRYKFNPSESRKLIEEHFGTQFSEKNPLKVIFHGKKGSGPRPYQVRIKEQLASVGIFVRFEGRERVRFSDDSTIVFREVSKGTTFTDPVSCFTSYVAEPFEKESEYTVVGDSTASSLLKEAKETVDRRKKAKSLSDLTKHCQREFRVLPLGESRNQFVFDSRIESIDIENISSSIDFTQIQMRK